MTKKIFVVFTVMALSVTLFGQGLTKDQLSKLAKANNLEGTNRLIYNAVSANQINELAVDREVMNNYSTIVNYKLDVKGITNQKSTGRCWMFAALNTMRPSVMKNFDLSSFDFSHNYLFFYDKLEKANMFLDAMIELRKKDVHDRDVEELIGDNIPDGGWWNYAVNLIEKYGAVPKEIMPETISSESSGRMNSILGQLLKYNAMELRKMAKNGANEKQLLAKKKTCSVMFIVY